MKAASEMQKAGEEPGKAGVRQPEAASVQAKDVAAMLKAALVLLKAIAEPSKAAEEKGKARAGHAEADARPKGEAENDRPGRHLGAWAGLESLFDLDVDHWVCFMTHPRAKTNIRVADDAHARSKQHP